MTESLLQAENKELNEQVKELSEQYQEMLAALRSTTSINDELIKENHRLVDTIFEKQAIIDDLNNSIDCLVKKISNLIPINHTIDELEKTK